METLYVAEAAATQLLGLLRQELWPPQTNSADTHATTTNLVRGRQDGCLVTDLPVVIWGPNCRGEDLAYYYHSHPDTSRCKVMRSMYTKFGLYFHDLSEGMLSLSASPPPPHCQSDTCMCTQVWNTSSKCPGISL